MKISIIVSAYNSASTIERCIDSVLGQKGADVELIVVNDGSTDNTIDVLDKYKGKLKLINKENGGVASGRNSGLDEASGDYVMFLDSDDALRPDCIELLCEKQRAYGAEVIRFEYNIISKKGEITKPLNYFSKEEFISKDDFKTKIYPFFVSTIRLNSVCMTLIKRSLISSMRFSTKMTTAEDALFSLDVYTRARNVLIIPDELYLYYRTEGSLTNSGLSVAVKYKCNFILSKKIVEHLKQWQMDTLLWRTKSMLRPVVLTLDKVKRMRRNS